jgi:hypothetical protein
LPLPAGCLSFDLRECRNPWAYTGAIHLCAPLCEHHRHIQRLRLPAGDFDVAPEACDAYHLDQRNFNLLAREYPERFRRVVCHAGAYRRVIDHGHDVELSEVVRRADATQHEQLRAAERARLSSVRCELGFEHVGSQRFGATAAP